MIEEKTSIELTTVFIPDKRTGFYSAFFAQFPEAIAQGETEKQAELNLLRIFSVMLKDRKEEVTKDLHELNYTTKPLNLVSA